MFWGWCFCQPILNEGWRWSRGRCAYAWRLQESSDEIEKREDALRYTQERREERAAIGQFKQLIRQLADALTPERLSPALENAQLPQSVRGYGQAEERKLGPGRRQARGSCAGPAFSPRVAEGGRACHRCAAFGKADRRPQAQASWLAWLPSKTAATPAQQERAKVRRRGRDLGVAAELDWMQTLSYTQRAHRKEAERFFLWAVVEEENRCRR